MTELPSNLRERIARALAEIHGAAGTTHEPFYTDDADAVLTILREYLADEAVVERVAMAASARRGSEVVWSEDREMIRYVLPAALEDNHPDHR